MKRHRTGTTTRHRIPARWNGFPLCPTFEWQSERHTLQNQALVIALRRDLDRGEAETITLALERGADLGLPDEREGQHAAQRLELCVASVVGLLLEAKSRSAVDAVRPHLDDLRHKAGLYLAEQVYRSAKTGR